MNTLIRITAGVAAIASFACWGGASRAVSVGSGKVQVGAAASSLLIEAPRRVAGYDGLGPSSLFTGFEPDEGFVPGWVDGQKGWSTFVSSAAEAHIDTANPEAGDQHLRIAKDPALPVGYLVGAFSPDLGPLPAVVSTVSMDINISELGGADYYIIPQSPSQGFKSAWVDFVWTDDIILVDDLGSGPEWVDTGVDWTPDVYLEFRIELDPFAGTIEYYYAGNLIYTGSVWAGTNIEQLVVYSDNYHDGDVGDYDNVEFGPSDTSVLLVADQPCYAEGDIVTMTVELAKSRDLVVGGQFFVSYDSAVLDFLSADVGDSPFLIEVYEDVDEAAGTIDYAVGVVDEGPGTMDDTTMAVITFGLIPGQELCTPTAGLVGFRSHDPPTWLTDDLGNPIAPDLYDLNAVSVDQEPPEVTGCPGDIVDHYADAGQCAADVTWAAAEVTDNCDSDPNVMYEIDLDDDSVVDDTVSATTYYFPVGTHRVRVVATDACGNTNADCDFTVGVISLSELVVDLELEPGFNALLERCITFNLRGVAPTADATVTGEVLFTGRLGTAFVEVPCGDYDCLLVGDALHTLTREVVDFAVVGVQYEGSAVDLNPMEPWEDGWDPSLNHALLGGNLNGDYDPWINILDFGIFVARYGSVYDSDGDTIPDGDTPCGMYSIHADVNGEGLVTTSDFTFIQANYLMMSEDCDGGPMPAGSALIGLNDAPLTRVSLKDLVRMGMPELIVADLNHDGWLDEGDITAFLDGARPARR